KVKGFDATKLVNLPLFASIMLHFLRFIGEKAASLLRIIKGRENCATLHGETLQSCFSVDWAM
ncbi:MAG: hypothetical protein ACI4V2_05355, partial [Alloprevotella sp.]